MSTSAPQTFRKHARFDPPYHVVAAAGLLFSLVLAVILLILNLHTQLLLGLWLVVTSTTLLVLYIKIRTYPLKVQDRVIRLEERLRLAALLPETLRRRISELSEDQLLGLRFASDAELASLVELTLEKQLNRKQIKERIQTWRPDYWRV